MLVLAEPTTSLVHERWQRARALGLSRDADAYPEGTSRIDLLERRARLEETFREERQLLDPICDELARDGRVVILADAEGIILNTRCRRELVSPVTRVRLVEGARWDESVRGTNAIGTAIAERQSVGVVGAAHFERRSQDIYCYATPIHDPYGELVAVLDVSGPLAEHDPSVAFAVRSAGSALERALRIMAFGDRQSGALAAIERLVHRSASAALLIDAVGLVRATNHAARGLLTTTGPLTCERIFGVGFRELVKMAQTGGALAFETRAGAFDVHLDAIAGPGGRHLAVLVHLDERAVAPARPARQENARPAASLPDAPRRSEVPSAPAFARIWGDDERVLHAKALAARFAPTALPVLLLAETGTGKELFARAIHDGSPRSTAPFIAINCGALAPDLISSELFGHAPGAFTGAARNGTEGRIAAASGGTLFLDEVAELPEVAQAALLRVLEDGRYQRVGEAKDRAADFRLVCATCRDLPTMVSSGRFRSDLYYRIRGACITLPSLRDRADKVWLAQRMLAHLSQGQKQFTQDALQWIAWYTFPGNVRELKSAVQHGAILADGAWVGREHLPEDTRLAAQASHDSRASSPAREARTKSEILREAIDDTLRACEGNVSEAARRLGVGRGLIYRMLRTRRA